MKISLFRSLMELHPDVIDIRWSTFVESQRHVVRNRGDSITLFSPAVFDESRLRRNVVAVSFGVLDFDHITDERLAMVRQVVAGYSAVLYSTKHHVASTGVNEVRLCVEFSKPCPVEQWAETFDALTEAFGGLADSGCRNPERIYYEAHCRPNTPASELIYEVYKGAPWVVT